MSLQLKAAKRVLLAAGFTSAEISELVRGIKADAWDKGARWAAVESGVIPSEHVPWIVPDDNPYRREGA